jgi:tRNA (guanine26-N2/guanine27-N2)-dimethyltransferase
MAGDRDIGVAFAAAWAKVVGRPLAGWEPTAATGVRGLRLLRESGAFERFRLTEANDEAVAVLRQNAARSPQATVEQEDGRRSPGLAEFDYVDVDPYGSPAEFVPAAFHAVQPGGVVAVTATDMMVLAGVQKGACERRYGARPIRGRLGPEGGLRILLGYLAGVAAERNLRTRPLLSYCRDHYVRAFVRIVADDPSEPPPPVSQVDPARWDGPELGDGGPWGPLWLGPLFDADLVRSIAAPATSAVPRETARFLDRVREEVGADVPFYYEPNRLAAALRLSAPPALGAMIDALRAAGFGAARTHARPEGFRTDAPRGDVAAIAQRLSAPR